MTDINQGVLCTAMAAAFSFGACGDNLSPSERGLTIAG
jgi:hypothetical protein